MSIKSIEEKYPSAIWYDSNHGGTNSGTLDNPYTSMSTAIGAIASNDMVIAVLDGTHNVAQSDLGGSSTTSTISLGGTADKLTFVGESINAVISTSGQTYGGSINLQGTTYALKLETLKLYHNGTNAVYGLINAGTSSVEVEGCILEMGESTLSATNRGWFSGGSAQVTSLKVINSVVTGGSDSTTYGAFLGGHPITKTYNVVDFQKNTFVITGGGANKFATYSTGITSAIFKDNIFVGNGNNEVLGFTPTIASNNCYHNNGISSGYGGVVFADPLFVDPANGDLRLRPNSPCIATLEDLDYVYMKPGSGTGTGTKDDPYYWSQYTSAFSDAVTTTSKTIIYEDGQYVVYATQINDSNIGNNIIHQSKNLHGAEFTNASRISATARPTLKIKNFKMTLVDHWVYDTGKTHDFDLDGCLVYWQKYSRFRNFKARGTVFSQALGFNGTSSEFIDVASTLDIDGCTIVDPNNSSSNASYNFIGSGTGTINKTIFYSTYTRTATAVNTSLSITMTDCAVQNVATQTGVTFSGDVLFVDFANEDYRLRPTSPLLTSPSTTAVAGAVYIQPGSGTGTGTLADPYYYNQLNLAESDVGSGGTILFLDGTYTFTGSQTWNAGGFDDMTYKSLNDYGAYLLGSSSIQSITYGSGTTATLKIEGFKSGNIFFQGNHLQTTALTLTKINHADTISGTRSNRAFIHTGSATNVCTISDSSFTLDYSGSDRLFQSLTNSTISRCSFYLKCTSVGTGGITNSGGAPTSSNTIFMSDNSNAIADSVVNPSVCTNCCIFQMHSNDSSGGTNNVFADPLFVDPANGDLRLRPNSPCISTLADLDYVYMQPGSGTGTGTKDDPYYWSQYTSAFSDAVTTTSKTIIYEDGQYLVSATQINDSNIGNNIIHQSKNLHGAEFTNTSRISATARPTLKIKNFKITLVDHWVYDANKTHDFDLDGCFVYWQKYSRFRNFKARGTVFSQALGFNGATSSQFLYAGTLDIDGCTIVDPNNSSSNASYNFITEGTGTINKTIFYSTYTRTATAVKTSLSITMTDCAVQNVATQTGVTFSGDVLFVDFANEDYRLRPTSPLLTSPSTTAVAGAVYIQPGSGTGSGTFADPYYYNQLSSAESDAGSGGTIFFLDGTYTATAFTWDANGVSYKSLNLHGATLEGSGVLRNLTLGHYSTSNVAHTLEGFVVNNCKIRSYQSTSSTAKNTIKNNKFTATLASATIMESQTQNTTDLINNIFNLDFDSGSSLSSNYSLGTLNGNTFYIDIDASVTSITSGFNAANIVGKNNIWVSTDSSKVGVSLASNDSFSCFHNFGSSNTSGGTSNVFSDPLFIDSANGNFRLRPSSPCIGAGALT